MNPTPVGRSGQQPGAFGLTGSAGLQLKPKTGLAGKKYGLQKPAKKPNVFGAAAEQEETVNEELGRMHAKARAAAAAADAAAAARRSWVGPVAAPRSWAEVPRSWAVVPRTRAALERTRAAPRAAARTAAVVVQIARCSARPRPRGSPEGRAANRRRRCRYRRYRGA